MGGIHPKAGQLRAGQSVSTVTYGAASGRYEVLTVRLGSQRVPADPGALPFVMSVASVRAFIGFYRKPDIYWSVKRARRRADYLNRLVLGT